MALTFDLCVDCALIIVIPEYYPLSRNYIRDLNIPEGPLKSHPRLTDRNFSVDVMRIKIAWMQLSVGIRPLRRMLF